MLPEAQERRFEASDFLWAGIVQLVPMILIGLGWWIRARFSPVDQRRHFASGAVVGWATGLFYYGWLCWLSDDPGNASVGIVILFGLPMILWALVMPVLCARVPANPSVRLIVLPIIGMGVAALSQVATTGLLPWIPSWFFVKADVGMGGVGGLTVYVLSVLSQRRSQAAR